MRCTVILAVLNLAGCETTGTMVSPHPVASLQVGVSTVAETITRFGTPDYRTNHGDGSVDIAYMHSRVWVAPLVYDMKMRNVQLHIGPDGKLSKSTTTLEPLGHEWVLT